MDYPSDCSGGGVVAMTVLRKKLIDRARSIQPEKSRPFPWASNLMSSFFSTCSQRIISDYINTVLPRTVVEEIIHPEGD